MSTPVPPYPKSRRRLMILLGFCIWVCGIAVGAGGVLLYPEVPEVEVGTSKRSRRGPEDVAKYLREAYQLTDAEMEGVRAIYEETFTKLQDVRRSIQPEMETVYQTHAEQMRVLLGEARYEKWHADIERKRKRIGQGRLRSMERRMRSQSQSQSQSQAASDGAAEASGTPEGESVPEENPAPEGHAP